MPIIITAEAGEEFPEEATEIEASGTHLAVQNEGNAAAIWLRLTHEGDGITEWRVPAGSIRAFTFAGNRRPVSVAARAEGDDDLDVVLEFSTPAATAAQQYIVIRGPAGQNGAAGAQGPAGAAGAQGPAGATGAAGAAGAQGPAGAAGAQGPAGAAGEQGPAGAAGADGRAPYLGLVSLSAAQVANLAVNDHVQFNTIATNSDATVSSAAGQGSGTFTVEVGTLLTAHIDATFDTANGIAVFQWRDLGTGNLVGVPGRAVSVDYSAAHITSAPAVLYSTTVIDGPFQLDITSETDLTGITTSSSCTLVN